MPPRYAYWTILVDDQPTAFRAGAMEDLLPTYKRLQQKHPSAKMMWFQNGQLWPSRHDAQEAMRERGERGRRGDTRQQGSSGRAEWRPKPTGDRPKLDWQPKSDSPRRPEWRPKAEARPKPEWRPKTDSRPKSEWRPKGGSTDRPRAAKPEWKPRDDSTDRREPRSSRPRDDRKPFARDDRKPFTRDKGWRPKPGGSDRPAPAKLEWKPRGEHDGGETKPAKPREPRKPQARDKNWRPGGDHRDPRQKYKDAKKAKWQRFKKQIRNRWDTKQDKTGKPAGGARPGPRKKRRDDES